MKKRRLMTDMPAFSIANLAAGLRSGASTSTLLVRNSLERIERLQPSLNAFITILADSAMRTALERDAELAAGRGAPPAEPTRPESPSQAGALTDFEAPTVQG